MFANLCILVTISLDSIICFLGAIPVAFEANPIDSFIACFLGCKLTIKDSYTSLASFVVFALSNEEIT